MRFAICAALFAVCLTALPAHAEQGEERKSYTLDAVTVTASKEKEKMQEVKASIDVFSGVDVEDAGAESISEVTGYMPNVLSKVNFGMNRIIFRGVECPDSSLFAPSGFFVDDVPYIIPGLRNVDLFDVESLEVLKGPQGTLYGGNSETGVVNIVTRKPGNEFGGSLSAGYGSFNTVRFKAGLDVPVVDDTLFFNFAVAGKKSDGYVKNKYDDEQASGQEHKNARFGLRWRPSDITSVDFTVSVFDYDDEDGSVRIESGAGSTDRHEINWDGKNRNDRWGDSQALRIKRAGTVADFISITTRNSFTSDYDLDADLTPVHAWDYAMDKDIEAYSQEFRLSSPEGADAPWKWLAGVYAMAQSTDYSKDSHMLTGFGMREQREADVDSQNMALFGQTTYTFWDRLHLTGGLRLDYIQLQGEQNYTRTVGGVSAYNRFEDDIYNTEILPKFSLGYDVTDDVMAYTSVSKGYLAGGFNVGMASSPDTFTYDPEHMWSYEVGVKSSWSDGHLLVNASAFWLEIEDKQVTEVVGPSRSIANADSARSRGMELSVKVRPVQGLDLFAGLGFLDTAFTDWETPAYDYEGKTLPFAPKYTYNAGVQYRHLSGLFGRLDMVGKTAFYTDPENEYECGGNQVYNARMGYAGDEWGVSLWCKNLFDSEYVTDRRQWSPGTVMVVDGAPRSVGLDVNWRF